MCGITGFLIKDPSYVRRHDAMEEMANLLLLGIEPRGRKATGFVAYKPGGIEVTLDKKDIRASEFVKERLPIPEGSTVWLGHTRYDTQGDPKDMENNHPVVCGNTFVTHNGSIYNDDELFRKHKKDRGAAVDSIAIAMLLDKYGLMGNEVREALEQLQGPFAIAAIDPIKNPDRVLLAKGEWSPCFIHESDKFIVWASEKKAIREAWQVILGTPPADKAFREMKEGEMIVVSKDGLETGRFEAQSGFRQRRLREAADKTHGHSGANQHVRTTYRPRTTSGTATVERRTPDTKLSPGRHVEEVGKVREEGRGTARLFELYQNGGYDIALFKEAEYPYAWEWCEGCFTCVLTDDMQDTVRWGYICNDCYDTQIGKLGYHDDEPELAGFLSVEELETLENWAKMESEVHKAALARVADETQLSPVTIDFLVFRVPDTYTDRRDDIKDLATDLDDAYQAALAECWSDFGVDDADNLSVAHRPESDSGVQVEHRRSFSPGERPSPDFRDGAGFTHCTTHQETFRSNEECSRCLKDFPSTIQDGTPDLSIKSCRVCRHRTKFHMLKWAWCGKHYKNCHWCAPGSELPANATAPNGDRLCHFCSRGQKGLLYDGDNGRNLERLGIEVSERNAR